MTLRCGNLSETTRFLLSMAVILCVSTKRLEAELTTYRFSGSVQQNYLPELPDWDPPDVDLIEGVFTFDTETPADPFGNFRNLMPTAVEVTMGDFRFASSSISLNVADNVFVHQGMGEPRDVLQVFSYDLIETTHTDIGFSLGIDIVDLDATMIDEQLILPNDLELLPSSSMSGWFVVAITGPGVWFTIDELEATHRVRGDLNGDFVVDDQDIDLLAERIRVRAFPAPDFDFTGDSGASQLDLIHLVKNELGTSFGDANLDGRFTSSDLVSVFTGGQYEDGIMGNSDWATGDWNGDGEI